MIEKESSLPSVEEQNSTEREIAFQKGKMALVKNTNVQRKICFRCN